jgi:hypothetical protein
MGTLDAAAAHAAAAAPALRRGSNAPDRRGRRQVSVTVRAAPFASGATTTVSRKARTSRR